MANPKLRHAVALGLLQGPTELLPVSSSGHTSLIPWLAGWPYAELEPELRKSFEVALHAGAGLALAIDMREELLEAALRLDRARAVVVALSLAPPAIAGYLLEQPIERRLGGPCSIAVGLVAGAVTMALADVRPGTVHGLRRMEGLRRTQDQRRIEILRRIQVLLRRMEGLRRMEALLRGGPGARRTPVHGTDWRWGSHRRSR